jgi:hypothetical protein
VVEPGVGAALPVGIVAGGHYYYVDNMTYVGGSNRRTSSKRFTFSYDRPIVEGVTPKIVAVEGGEDVLVVGDNFGPSGTPVMVEPAGVLRCDHSNTSHTRITCTTLPGRGDGLAVHVTVEGQRSDAINGGGNTASEVGQDGASVNISYFPPLITSVDPNRGAANSPEKITIYGNSFGKSPTNVRVFIGGRPCANAAWMPENPPTYPKSYIQCSPPDGDVSGKKNITLLFSDDSKLFSNDGTFLSAKLLYDPLHFYDMYVHRRATHKQTTMVSRFCQHSISNICCRFVVAISCSGTRSLVLQESTAL